MDGILQDGEFLSDGATHIGTITDGMDMDGIMDGIMDGVAIMILTIPTTAVRIIAMVGMTGMMAIVRNTPHEDGQPLMDQTVGHRVGQVADLD